MKSRRCSTGVTSCHGIASSSETVAKSVTHVVGLFCYLCPRTEPTQGSGQGSGRTSMRPYLTVALLAGCVGCGAPQNTASSTANTAASASAADFEKLTDDLLYGSLALSPVSATQTGYHEHNGVQLDEQIDDFSAAGMDAQRRFWEGLKTRIDALNSASLDKEQQADLDIMKNQINL